MTGYNLAIPLDDRYVALHDIHDAETCEAQIQRAVKRLAEMERHGATAEHRMRMQERINRLRDRLTRWR